MGVFSLIKGFLEYSKRTQENNTSTTGSHNVSVGDNSSNNKVEQINSHNKSLISLQLNLGSDKVDTSDNKLVSGRIKEIRQLIDADNSKQALKELQELLNSFVGTGTVLTVNDRFSILLNIYTCYINIGEFESEIGSLENVIRNDLNTADEYYKFKYLYALNKFKGDNSSEIISLCEDVLNDKPDYFKAKILMLVAQTHTNELNMDEALRTIDEIIATSGMTEREKSYAVIAKGDIVLNHKEFDMAVTFYSEAYALQGSLNYKAGIALAYYLKAVREAEPSGFINFSKLDFETLHKARLLFDEIYIEAIETKSTGILKQILPYYMNSLAFTEETEQILDLRKQASEIIDMNQRDIAIITAHAELFSGGINEETMKSLGHEDRLKLELKQLAMNGNYEEVNRLITPKMDDIFKEDESMIAMYLISLFRNRKENFISELKRYKEKNTGDIRFNLIWIQSLEFKGKTEEALVEIKKLLEKNPVPLVVMDAYKYYERHKLEDDLFELSLCIVTGKYSVIPSDLTTILREHFFLLLNRKNYEEAEDFYNTLNLSDFSQKDALQIEVEYYRLIGRLDMLADKTLEYGILINDNRFIVSGASIYAVTSQLSKGIRILEDLKRSGKYEKSDLYMTLSKMYVLNGENEKAFESASKAKEIDKDLYKSPSHGFFVTIGMRVNKTDDSIKHLVEFHEKFPKEEWIRSGNVLKKDDDGNDVLDEDEFKKLIGDKSGYNEIRDKFFDYQFGLSSYMDLFKDLKLDFIIGELRYRKKKIKISEGNVKDIFERAELVENRILVDSLALYVLADAGILDLLKDFSEVQVSYSTIEYLSAMLMTLESSVVREILKFISDSMNVKLVSIKQEYMKTRRGFLDETLFNMYYSKANEIVLVTAEFNLKKAFPEEGEYIIDIPTVLEGLSIRDETTRKKCTSYILSLISSDYTFISFNVANMMDTFTDLENYDNIREDFKIYLCMSGVSDYNSFVNVYFLFLNAILDKVDEEEYMKFLNMIVDYLDWYVGRTRYYFTAVESQLKRLEIKPTAFSGNLLCSSIMALSVKVEENIWSDKYKVIARDPIFNKYHSIVSTIMSGIYAFLIKYKEDDEKLDFYFYHFKDRFEYIDSIALELMFTEVKKHDKLIKKFKDSQS